MDPVDKSKQFLRRSRRLHGALHGSVGEIIGRSSIPTQNAVAAVVAVQPQPSSSNSAASKATLTGGETIGQQGTVSFNGFDVTDSDSDDGYLPALRKSQYQRTISKFSENVRASVVGAGRGHHSKARDGGAEHCQCQRQHQEHLAVLSEINQKLGIIVDCSQKMEREWGAMKTTLLKGKANAEPTKQKGKSKGKSRGGGKAALGSNPPWKPC